MSKDEETVSLSGIRMKSILRRCCMNSIRFKVFALLIPCSFSRVPYRVCRQAIRPEIRGMVLPAGISAG